MENKKRKPKTSTPKTVDQIEEIIKEIKNPKITLSKKINDVADEIQLIMIEERKNLNTSSCAFINKAISDLKRVAKNLER